MREGGHRRKEQKDEKGETEESGARFYLFALH